MGMTPQLHIQTALTKLENMVQTLGLKFAPDKTKAMAFKTPNPRLDLWLTDKAIEWTDDFQYLGVIFDKWLTFRPHTDMIVTRAKKRLNLMRAMTSHGAGASAKVLKTFYAATTRSIIDYAACALILGEAKNLDKLEKMQNETHPGASTLDQDHHTTGGVWPDTNPPSNPTDGGGFCNQNNDINHPECNQTDPERSHPATNPSPQTALAPDSGSNTETTSTQTSCNTQ